MVLRVCMGALALGSGMEGEMILETADALNLAILNTWFDKRRRGEKNELNLAILNTWFKKKERRMFTYESRECRTVVDYILSRKSERKRIRDVKVVKLECINITSCLYYLKERVQQCKVKPAKRCKVWKLKQAETKGIFSERVQARAVLVRDEPGDVEKVWKDLIFNFIHFSHSKYNMASNVQYLGQNFNWTWKGIKVWQSHIPYMKKNKIT